MAISVSNTTLNDSFNTWRNNTNEVATIVSNNVVTVSRAGSANRSGVSTGNGHIKGTFTANELRATTIKGGNTSTDSSITIASNTTISPTTLTISANTTISGNVIINTTGAEIFDLGSSSRLRITGGSAGQFLRKSGSVGLDFEPLTLRQISDLSTNSAHIILSGANSNFITGASPSVKFSAGFDSASIYLAHSGTVGDSDLNVTLVDNVGDSALNVTNAANTTMASISSYGAITGNTIQTTGGVGIGGSLTTGYQGEVKKSFKVGENLQVAGNTDITGSLTVTGSFTVPANAAFTAADATFINLHMTGNTHLGDSSSDQIDTTGVFVNNIIPKAGDDHDLGSTSSKWGHIYANNIHYYNTVQFGTTTIFGSDGSLHVNNAIADGEIRSAKLANTMNISTFETHGSGSQVPVISVNKYGQVIGISNTAVAGVTGFSYSSANNNLRITTATGTTYDDVIDPATTSTRGVASFDSGDFDVSSGAVSLKNATTGAVLAVSGTSNEVNVSRSNGTVTVGLPDDVTVTGQLNVGENVVVTGNLIVQGTTTTVNSETVNIADNIIVLNSNETGTPSQNGGITIERGTSTNKQFIWDESSDKWSVGSETMVAATFEGNLTGNVTGNVTGNLDGTAELANTAVKLQTPRQISLGGDANGAITFDGTGNQQITVSLNTSAGDGLSNYMTVANTQSLVNSRLGGTATVQISGDVAGSASFSSNSVNVSVTQQNNSVDLGTHTTGNYVATIAGTTNQVNVSGSGSETAAVTLSLPQNVHTSATPQFSALGVNTAGSGGAGTIRATSSITAYYSDARLKNFLGNIDGALDKVNQLNGYYFEENEVAKSLGYDNDEVQVGVSAQEVEAVLPHVVTDAPINDSEMAPEGADYKTVYYEKLVPLLIEAIKELSAKVDKLEGNK